MIGLSLPYGWLLGRGGLIPRDELLPMLKSHGVNSVEIRTVPGGADPDEVLKVAELLWGYGFNITVHGNTNSAEKAVAQVLLPLEKVVLGMKQRELIVTIHPICGDNLQMLLNLSDYIKENKLPIRIAFENERKMPDKTDGDSLALALDAVMRANRENIGICFDMGHFAWYSKFFSDSPCRLPPKEFLSRVIHTHIHECVDGSTHFPLLMWEKPVSSYVKALDREYFGVYNLELSPERFTHVCGAVEGYLRTVDTLKSNLPFSARLYEDIKLNYARLFRNALDVFEKKDGSYVSLIGPTAYLFNTNGYKWAMDVAFRNLRYLADAPSRVREYLGDIELMVLTHGHEDHMEESTIRQLADTSITWLVPEFLVNNVEKCGVKRENITVARVGDEVTIGPLAFKVLEGRHFRPENGKGIDAVGYFVSAKDAPSMVFPGDVRDYRTSDVCNMDADCCFAHVWLTDDALDREKYVSKSREFAEFMLKMSKKRILLAHLYESGRDEMGMWQMHHADVAKKSIFAFSRDTDVYAPICGDVICLG